MNFVRSAFFAVVVISLVAPASALGFEPGDSALDQYVEQVPGVTGNNNSNDPGARDPAKVIGDKPARKLEAHEDGEAVAAVAAATVSSGTGGFGNGPESRSGRDPGRSNSGTSGSANDETDAGMPSLETSVIRSSDEGDGWNIIVIIAGAVVIAAMIGFRFSGRRTADS